jgi:hypothetical protein
MSLKVGDVFLAINLSLSGDKPHFHIVVQKTKDNLVVVTYTTTKIEETKRHCRRVERITFPSIEPATIVLVSPSDSGSFTEECAINCNHVQMMSEESYTTRPAFKLLLPIINTALIDKIREAIKQSPIVEQKIIKTL